MIIDKKYHNSQDDSEMKFDLKIDFLDLLQAVTYSESNAVFISCFQNS